MKHLTHLTRYGIETPITVEYTPHKAYRGATDGPHGPPIEPSEPAWIEIDGCTDADGKDVEITDDEVDEIGDEIAEYLAELELASRSDEVEGD